MGYDISIIVRRRNAETRVQLEGKGLTLYLGLHNLRLKLKNNKKKAASLKLQASSHKRLKKDTIE